MLKGEFFAMANHIANLIVEFEKYNTRCIVIYKNKKYFFTINNIFGIAKDNDLTIPNEYSDNSSVVSINTSFNGNTIIGNYINGKLQDDKVFDTWGSLQFSDSEKKYKQDVIVLVIRIIIYRALLELKNHNDIINIYEKVDWNMIILMPRDEIHDGRLVLNDILKNLTTINMYHPKLILDTKIESIEYIPEGLCAYIACAYDNRSNIDVKNSSTLVLDAGMSGVTISLIENNKLNKEIYFKTNKSLNDTVESVVNELMLRGVNLKKGDILNKVFYNKSTINDFSVETEFNKSIKDVANSIYREVISYLSNNNIELSGIDNILITGKGAMCGCSNLHSLRHELYSLFDERINLIELPNNSIVENGIERNVDFSDLNLIGASILSDVII